MYPTEKAMAPYSSTLAWKIPWIEEPGRLQSMGLLRVRHVHQIPLTRKAPGQLKSHLTLCRREKQSSKDSRLLSPWEEGRVSSILAMHLTERLTKPPHFWEPEDPAVAHHWPQAPPLAMRQVAGPCFWTGWLSHPAPVNFNGRYTSKFPCTCGVANSYICGLIWAPVSSVKRWSDFV